MDKDTNKRIDGDIIRIWDIFHDDCENDFNKAYEKVFEHLTEKSVYDSAVSAIFALAREAFRDGCVLGMNSVADGKFTVDQQELIDLRTRNALLEMTIAGLVHSGQ